MKALVAALKESSERTRLLLLGLSGATAAVVGFRWVPVATAKNLIQYGGYYYILAVFLGACYYGIRIAAARRESWLPRLRRPGVAGAAIVLATLFLFWSDTFKHKILFDEYVLQGTAYHMHATKEIGAVVRAYDINGSWLVIDTFLDKRPYFFAFLVSLLHDLTGYRVANIFVVNALLTPVLLGLVYWLARELTGLKPALFSLALLATLPLLGQNVSCAGMELHNLTMIAAVMVFAVLYLRSPSPDRLSLLMFGGHMTIDEFRGYCAATCGKKQLVLSNPPMQSVTLQVEEVNESDVSSEYRYIPLDTDRVSRYQEKVRLTRSKPLVNFKNTLDHSMKLKYGTALTPGQHPAAT